MKSRTFVPRNNDRISKSIFLNDTLETVPTKLNKFVSLITNLSINTAETWQIANYGIGGQYMPHYDYIGV